MAPILLEMEAAFYEDQPMTLLYAGSEISAASGPMGGIQANYLDPLAGVEDWTK